MFRSKRRPIIIPQYEHGRLAGVIAQHWGNEQFDRPALPFAAFVEGVTFHDWHYGFADNLPISGAAEADWLAMTRRGLDRLLDDPVADIVAKLHVRRLLSYNESAERVALMAEIDDYVTGRLPATGLGRADFDWADSLTQFCDNIAFFFSFEAPFSREMTVHSRRDPATATAVQVEIDGAGAVRLAPWPLNVPALSGAIIGFAADGYPERLRPLVVAYDIKPGG